MSFRKGDSAGRPAPAARAQQPNPPARINTPSFGTRATPPFATPRPSLPVIAGGDSVGKLLKEGDFEKLSSLGITARPALFRILVAPKEEWLVRLSCAEFILQIEGKTREHERVMAFLVTGDIKGAASVGTSSVLTLTSIMKNRNEQMLLRNNAILALAFFAQGCRGREMDSAVVYAMSAVLSSKSESLPLRCNIAYAIVGVGALCEGAKLRMVESALRRAAGDENDTLKACAEDALQLLREKKRARAPDDDDDATTQRLPGGHQAPHL
ncbi:MAG: hypothetical protein PHY95_04440 [Candidatus ainarchaeum sp.]|nr:hypothetical protein [Candidatus ainarchaeum sp.]